MMTTCFDLTCTILLTGELTLGDTSERWNDLQDLGGTAVHLSSAASNFVDGRGVYSTGKIPAMNTRSVKNP